MAAEMVNMATSDKLKETDWMKNIEICELVGRDPGQAKDVVKSIKKRLGSKNCNTQLYAVMTDFPVRERIFLLLDATQTALGGATGKFPQYYAAYYDLVSARVQFPQRSCAATPESQVPVVQVTELPAQDNSLSNHNDVRTQTTSQTEGMPDLSIIQKATSVMEVLRDVLNSLNPKHPEGATDEFVLDLVEQCSFQKQRVMHLVMTSRDDKVVTQAIDLNEQLHKLLIQHDALLSVRPTSTIASCINEEEEEEDAERLYWRICKGKACAEDHSEDSRGSFRSVPEEKMRRPLIRPLSIQPSSPEGNRPPAVSIPPPPAKHIEREQFFKEKNMDAPGLSGHIRGLSLHSRDRSSSHSGSTDFSD